MSWHARITLFIENAHQQVNARKITKTYKKQEYSSPVFVK